MVGGLPCCLRRARPPTLCARDYVDCWRIRKLLANRASAWGRRSTARWCMLALFFCGLRTGGGGDLSQALALSLGSGASPLADGLIRSNLRRHMYDYTRLTGECGRMNGFELGDTLGHRSRRQCREFMTTISWLYIMLVLHPICRRIGRNASL